MLSMLLSCLGGWLLGLALPRVLPKRWSIALSSVLAFLLAIPVTYAVAIFAQAQTYDLVGDYNVSLDAFLRIAAVNSLTAALVAGTTALRKIDTAKTNPVKTPAKKESSLSRRPLAIVDQDLNAPPLNPLPMIVWVLALPLIAMEVVLQLAEGGLVGGQAAIGWRLQAMEMFALRPDKLHYAIETGVWTADAIWRLVSYTLVQANFTAALFVVVLLLALGKMVGEVFRWWAVVVVFIGAAVVGAVIYTLVLPGNRMRLIGGYPAVYGLIGAFTYLLWMRQVATGGSQYRAFGLIGMLMAIQFVFGMLFGGGYYWVAELSGFVAGLLLSFVVSPGGWGRVMRRLRRR